MVRKWIWSGVVVQACTPVYSRVQDQLDDLVRPVSEKSVCVCVAEDMTG